MLVAHRYCIYLFGNFAKSASITEVALRQSRLVFSELARYSFLPQKVKKTLLGPAQDLIQLVRGFFPGGKADET